MVKEKCWQCKKFKSNVKLCARDDYVNNVTKQTSCCIEKSKWAWPILLVPRWTLLFLINLLLQASGQTEGHVKDDGQHKSTESNKSTGEGISFHGYYCQLSERLWYVHGYQDHVYYCLLVLLLMSITTIVQFVTSQPLQMLIHLFFPCIIASLLHILVKYALWCFISILQITN